MNSNNTDRLKDFIEQNRGELSSYEPIEGDSERFIQKFRASAASKKAMHRKIAYATIIPATCIAALALFLLLGKGITIGNSNDSIEILENRYISQLEEMANQMVEMYEKDGILTREELKSSLESIIKDSITLQQQLSDELSIKEKTKILRDYYKQKMEGLGQFKVLYAQADILE